jgi:PAS domain S-box-containing protein
MPNDEPASRDTLRLVSHDDPGPRGVVTLQAANRILRAGLLASTDEELGATCLSVAEELTGSAFGFIGELSEAGGLYDLAVSDPGWDACGMYDQSGHRKRPAESGIVGLYGRVIETGRPVCTNQPEASPHSIGVPEGHPPLHSFLGVPLAWAGRTAGIVAVANREGGYSEADVAALESLAPAIAAALYNRRAATQLTRSRQLLDAHLRNSPLAVIEFDPDFRVIRWSDEATKVFGWEADEVLGRKIAELRWVYEADVPQVEKTTAAFLDGTGSRLVTSNRNYRKDGSIIWCEWYNSAIYDEQHRLASVLSLVLDVTARQRGEERERERERLGIGLAAIEADIHSSLDLEFIIQKALETGAEVLGADTGAISLYEPPSLRVINAIGFPSDLRGTVIAQEREPHSLLALRTRLPVLVEDTRHDARVDSEHLMAFGVHAVMVLPLIVGGEAMGLIYYNFGRPRRFSEAEDDFARRLSSSIALAMENSRLYESAQAWRLAESERAERMLILRELSEIGAAAQGVGETTGRQVETLVDALGAVMAVILVESAEGETLIPAGLCGISDEQVATHFGPVRIDGESPSARAYAERTPSFIEGALTDPDLSDRARDFNLALGMHSGASLPLVVSDEVVGTLAIGWSDAREFEPDDVAFLSSIASEIAIGLQNARLHEAERAALAKADRELETSTLLLEAADALVGSLDLEEILGELVRIAVAATGRSRVVVALYDVAHDELVVEASSGAPTLEVGRRILLHSPRYPLVGAWLTSAASSVIDFDRAELPDPVAEIVGALEARLALSVPIILGAQAIGFVWVDEPGRHREFEPREIEIIEGLTAHAGVAIEKATLYEQRGRRARLAIALNAVNSALHSSMEFDVIMDRVSDKVLETLDLDAAGVLLHANGRLRLGYSKGLTDEMISMLTDRSLEESPATATALDTRSPLVVNDASASEHASVRAFAELGLTSFVAVPLVLRDAPLGLMFACRLGRPGVFDEYDVDFAEKVGATLSLALSNAAAYQTEKTVAQRLQEAMITLPAEVRGIDFACEYRSASEPVLVGGDFYDLFEIDGDLVGITIGDVSGKGLESAIITSQLKNAIRAHAHEKGRAPGRILSIVNDVAFKGVPTEVFSTVFFGVLSRLSGTLTYANAGQEMGMVVCADGSVDELGPTGPILGAFNGVKFEETAVSVGSGALVLFTDGITEARRQGVMFGEARLRELLVELGAVSSAEVVQRVMDRISDFTGGRLRDDVALLVVRRDGGGETSP